ncbi:16891_t:CDS:2 [Acaulospora colombiana]|uniref:16891_t:CDS:1 n=1 Tax=Acaulospora colombiana TaxID=27376 RepID=A0ACA9N1X8_9GLOM|nr:16891_t:CDS:2 [Acaulospora colombiana]
MSWICDGLPCKLVEERGPNPVVGEGVEHSLYRGDSPKAEKCPVRLPYKATFQPDETASEERESIWLCPNNDNPSTEKLPKYARFQEDILMRGVDGGVLASNRKREIYWSQEGSKTETNTDGGARLGKSVELEG